MKLRALAAELEPALERLQATPEGHRPCVVVEHGTDTGRFIQYYGGYAAPLRLMVCLNPDTREIPGFEAAAKTFFGSEARVDESETFADWTKTCASVVRAVEVGMHALRHVLMLEWDAELRIEEFVQSKPRQGPN